MNNKKNALKALLQASCIIFMLPTVVAAEVNWQLRGTLGLQQYELRFADIVIPSDPPIPGAEITFRDGFEVEDQQTFGGVGLTASFGRFSIDLSGQRSGTGKDTGQQFQGNQQLQNNPFGIPVDLGVNHSLNSSFDREELNLNFGYGITNNITLFAGYKDAESTIRNTLAPIGEIGFFALTFEGDRIADFSYDGWQAGAATAIPVDKLNGTFSVQAAVVFLNGDFVERFEGQNFVATPAGPVEVDPSLIVGGATVSGDSVGVNVGVAWTGRFSKDLPKLLYTIGFDHSRYEFETDQTAFGDFEEKNTRLRFDLRYRF